MLKSKSDQKGGGLCVGATTLSAPETHPVPGATLPICPALVFLRSDCGEGKGESMRMGACKQHPLKFHVGACEKPHYLIALILLCMCTGSVRAIYWFGPFPSELVTLASPWGQ